MSSSKILAIIIDDEYHGRENLRILIEKFCPHVTVIQTFEQPMIAFKFLETNKVDLVFLDIGMPEIDGLEFLSLIPNRTFEVIFVTAYEDFAIRAIKQGVLDYLVKPVSVEELKKAVNKAFELASQSQNVNFLSNNYKISIATSIGTEIIDTRSVVFIESDTYLCSVYLSATEKIVVSKTLKYFEEILPTNIFCRIHRSYLINLNFIESYSSFDGGTVKLKGIKSSLPISRRNKAGFINKMKTFTR